MSQLVQEIKRKIIKTNALIMQSVQQKTTSQIYFEFLIHHTMKKLLTLLLFFCLINVKAVCQVDSSEKEQNSSSEISEEKKKPKRVSDFKIYGGVSTSSILLENSIFESAYAAGYLLGVSYRKGRFGYWEIGVNYNNSAVSLEGINILQDNLQIRQLELPLTAGINLLSITRRVLGLRFFGGLVPGYIAGISSNPFDLEVKDFNRFQLSGRAGIGVDVFFLFFETGYQYGFIDVLEDQGSNMSQVDFRLGFRF